MRRRLLLAALACAALALLLGAAPAGAVTPRLYELPEATEPGQIAFAPDGSAWVFGWHGAEFAGGEGEFLGRWSAAGGLVEVPLPEGFESGAEGAVATDGSFLAPGWTFGEGGKGASVGGIARVPASGRPEVQSLEGGSFSVVNTVAPAAAGGAWFAASHYHHYIYRFTVGRVDAAGSVVGQPRLLPFGCEVLAMAAGAGGSVWFTESCWRKPLSKTGHRASVDEIEPSGTIVRHPIASRFEPISLAIAPGGSAWFGETQQFGGFAVGIGRVTPAGKVVEYKAPKEIAPGEIALGPGGRLWFGSTTGGSVVRAVSSIGPGGDVGPRVCLAPHCSLTPSSLATGPEGNVWFTADGLRSSAIGGGGSGLAEDARIANLAGTVGLLEP
jgi:streptogramin lyase